MFKMLYSEKSTLYFNYNKDMDIEPDDNVSLWNLAHQIHQIGGEHYLIL